MKLVKVRWKDAGSVDSWCSPQEILEWENPCITSVGYLVQDDAGFVGIAGTWNEENNDVCCVMIVPRALVLSIEDLNASVQAVAPSKS